MVKLQIKIPEELFNSLRALGYRTRILRRRDDTVLFKAYTLCW